MLQLNHIKKFDKVVFQNDVVGLSKVRIFYDDFKNDNIKEKYIHLVECLKRKISVEDISIKDIKGILDELENMEN